MIKIIAVEPEVMANPAFFREYLKDFGTARGRWIPLFPSDWRSKVSRLIKENRCLKPLEANELRERLQHPKFKDRYVKVDLTCNSRWTDDVANLCHKKTFDGAIVLTNPNNLPFFLVAGSFNPDSEIYTPRVSIFSPRDPGQLAALIGPIIRYATEIHIVDQYCMSVGSSQSGYGAFFEGIFQITRQQSAPIKILNLYRKWEATFNKNREEVNYRSWLQPVLAKGESVRIHYLKERPNGETLHFRAVFTDQALATGHYGFGGSKKAGETTDFCLRELEDLQKVKTDYCHPTKRAFDLSPEQIIEISG